MKEKMNYGRYALNREMRTRLDDVRYFFKVKTLNEAIERCISKTYESVPLSFRTIKDEANNKPPKND